MSLPRKCDWWLYPVEIVAGQNDSFVVREGATDYVATIAAGVYWPHKRNLSTYPGLFYAIVTAVNATAAANTYAIEVATPTSSYEQTRGGVKITSTGAFTFKFSLASSVDPAWFGLPSSPTSVAGTLNAGTGLYEVISQYRANGILRTQTRGGDGIASIKRIMPETESTDSHARPSDRYTLEWQTDDVAEFSYEYVVAAHVFDDDAGTLVDYATMEAGLAVGDNYSTWQRLWEQFKKSRAILLLPDHEDWDLTFDGVGASAHIRYSEPLAQRFGEMINRRVTAGEAYDVQFQTYVVETFTSVAP
jgi:hypothetical protein